MEAVHETDSREVATGERPALDTRRGRASVLGILAVVVLLALAQWYFAKLNASQPLRR